MTVLIRPFGVRNEHHQEQSRETQGQSRASQVRSLPARFSGIFLQKFSAVEIRPQLHADRGVERKPYEDTLDAVVCAWVAMCALEGRGVPFGDESSAVRIPGRKLAL